jgi:hypothetical protein
MKSSMGDERDLCAGIRPFPFDPYEACFQSGTRAKPSGQREDLRYAAAGLASWRA